jgi:tRNA G18 (ribose-2'-O)-methylase SpoU
MIARTFEVLGINTCYIFDNHRLIKEKYGKRNRQRIRSISAGAFECVEFIKILEPIAFLNEYKGRKISTVLDNDAISIHNIKFVKDDLLIFGSEVNGIPKNVIEKTDIKIKIPMFGKTQSMNIAVAAGIILYEARKQVFNE